MCDNNCNNTWRKRNRDIITRPSFQLDRKAGLCRKERELRSEEEDPDREGSQPGRRQLWDSGDWGLGQHPAIPNSNAMFPSWKGGMPNYDPFSVWLCPTADSKITGSKGPSHTWKDRSQKPVSPPIPSSASRYSWAECKEREPLWRGWN